VKLSKKLATWGKIISDKTSREEKKVKNLSENNDDNHIRDHNTPNEGNEQEKQEVVECKLEHLLPLPYYASLATYATRQHFHKVHID